ncbi:hypothetical protein GOP47_0014040 [Adiantum capillus-veneris]|uniref:BZIP domain-containing protein n=1 Tax=Adiantum capillus-veneris TaxID=13818 RepID=A0A9D4UQ67_ADICA|nr:hypothetical protein GOP47_0014040 [Adiantum capillus-veneris]
MASSNYGNPETPLLRGGSSLYSLTFEEFQNVLGDRGTNLESMNMDELLKNIWTAEESQAMAAAMNSVEGLNGGLASQFSLQKQASLSLPRTLSARTVEDVWKSLQPQQPGAEAVPSSINHQRQITLGEVTLEDFLMKAGIARGRPPLNHVPSKQVPKSEVLLPFNQVLKSPTMHNAVPSSQLHHGPNIRPPTPSNFMHEVLTGQTFSSSNQMHAPAQQQAHPNPAIVGLGRNRNTAFPFARADGISQNEKHQSCTSVLNNSIPATVDTLMCPPSSNGTRFDALNTGLQGQQGDWVNNSCLTYQSQQGPQPVQGKDIVDTTHSFGNFSNGTNHPLADASAGQLSPLHGGLGSVLGTGGLGMNLGANPGSTRISFGAGSPLSPAFDEGSPGTSNFSLSLMTDFGNGQQQRRKRCAEAPVERVIERRQRRMIKNRESAARSRARKQAYTVELEAEVSQLKEENMKLLRKQEEEAARRKKQILAFMPAAGNGAGYKGRSLKRTHTGPW